MFNTRKGGEGEGGSMSMVQAQGLMRSYTLDLRIVCGYILGYMLIGLQSEETVEICFT